MAANASRKWFIVGLLSLGMVIAYLNRMNLSVVLALAEFKKAFQLTDANRGALNSAFFWTYALLQIPAGWVVDRYGVKFPYALGFLFWCLVSALTGAVDAIWQILVLRLLLGVGESVVTPASMRWIRFNCQEQERGLAVGLYMAGTKLGPAIGAPAAAWLISVGDWRTMFVILGLGGLIWLVLWLWLVRDDDRQLERAEARASGASAVSIGRVMASPVMWGIIVGTFAYNYFVYFSMTWLPAYFVEHWKLSLTSMGWYTMFSFGGMATVAALAGWVADRIIARGGDPVRVRKAFTIAGLMLASTEVIGPGSDSQTVALFFAVFSLSGLGLATANYWALTQTLIPGAAIGRIVGVQNCASNLSGVVAPLLTGWLMKPTGGFQVPMQTVSVLLLVGVAAYVFLVRTKYAPGAYHRGAIT
jgi:ACS family D-galactonate transporter-like MFS transporter